MIARIDQSRLVKSGNTISNAVRDVDAISFVVEPKQASCFVCVTTDLGLVMTNFLRVLSSSKQAGARLQSIAPISRPLHPNRCSNQERDPMKDIPGIDEDGNPKNGPFKLFFKNGLISCQGEFDNGKKSGKWKYFLNNGQMQSSGSFKDGKIVGRWKWFFKTGEPRATGGFDDEEQKHGAWKRYHANGQLWDEGRFEHGKKRGTWKVYDEAGELLKTQTFK